MNTDNISQLFHNFKGPLSSLRQFLTTTEIPFKMMKNAFYFMLKAIFVFMIFMLLFWLFGHVGRRLDKKAKVDFNMYYVKTE